MKSLTKLQLFNVDFLYKRKQSAIFILFVHATYVAGFFICNPQISLLKQKVALFTVLQIMNTLTF